MAKKAYQNYIKAMSNRIEHKKMYKAKKQWIVAGISFLAVMGLGAGVSNANASANATKDKVTNPQNHKAKLSKKVTLKPAKENNRDKVMKAAKAKHAKILAHNKKRIQSIKKALAKRSKQEKSQRSKKQVKLLKQRIRKNHKNLAKKHHVIKKHNVRKHAKRRIHTSLRHVNRKNKVRTHKAHKVIRVRNHKAHKMHKVNKPFAANSKEFRTRISKLGSTRRPMRLPSYSSSYGNYYKGDENDSDPYPSINSEWDNSFKLYKQRLHSTPYRWHFNHVLNFDGTWIKQINFYHDGVFIGSSDVSFPQDGKAAGPAKAPSGFKIIDQSSKDGQVNDNGASFTPVNTGFNNHILAEDYNPDTGYFKLGSTMYKPTWSYVNLDVEPVNNNTKPNPTPQPSKMFNNIKYVDANGNEVGWAIASGYQNNDISNVILKGLPNNYMIASSSADDAAKATIQPAPYDTHVITVTKQNTRQNDNDTINYVYNGQNEGSQKVQGYDGNTGVADGTGLNSGYKLANDGSQYYVYNNGSHNVDVLPSNQTATVYVEYTDNNNPVGRVTAFTGAPSDSATVGSDPDGLPSNYSVKDPNQVINYNQGFATVPVTKNAVQDTIRYTLNGQPVGKWTPTGASGSNFTVNSQSPNVPQNYGVSNPETVPYDGGTHDVPVTPQRVTDEFNFISNGKYVGHTSYSGPYDQYPISLGADPEGLDQGYEVPSAYANAQYNLDGNTYNINVSPVQTSPNNSTDTFNYTYNGKPVGQTKFEGPSSDYVNLGDDPEGLQDGYRLPNSDAEQDYALDGGTRNIAVNPINKPTPKPAPSPKPNTTPNKTNNNPAPTPSPTPNVQPEPTPNVPNNNKNNFITNVNDLRNGQVGTYHGVQIQRINMNKNLKYSHFKWFKINRKGAWIHTDILSVGHNRNYVLYMRPKHGIFHRISRVFVVRFNNKIVGVRYEFRIGKMNYFVTANPKFTDNSYWQKFEMGNKRHHTLKVIRPCAEYSSKYYNHKTHRRTFRVGKRIHIKGIINIGRRGDYQTRFILDNGHYITANKNYVKLVK